VAMSCVELALLLSKPGLPSSGRARFRCTEPADPADDQSPSPSAQNDPLSPYRAFLSYAQDPDVAAAVCSLPLGRRWGLKAVPFRLLKARLYRPLFWACALLNACGYRFERGGS